MLTAADAAGKLLATIDPPAPNVSNVAFGPDASMLYVTGVLDAAAAPWRGKVYRIGNPVPQQAGAVSTPRPSGTLAARIGSAISARRPSSRPVA